MEEEYKKETIASYDAHAAHHSQKFQRMFDLSRRPEFAKFMKYLHGRKILDLGCGPGYHAQYFSTQGLDVVAADLSDEMVALCKAIDLNVVKMDIENITLEDNSFDGVWAVTSLLHIPKKNMRKVISDICRVLKKDGVLYVSFKEGDGEGFIPDVGVSSRRYFAFWREDELVRAFNTRFDVIESWTTTAEGKTFAEALFRKK